MEYQKGYFIHGVAQRPDIIFHIPTEVSGGRTYENNYAVWAVKLDATERGAKDDFDKLDDMFHRLEYPLGFFINVASQDDMLEHYQAEFPDRLIGISVWLEDREVRYAIRNCHTVARSA